MKDNLTSIINVLFRNRRDWELVTDEMKNKWFFIVNRYLSKIYPEQAYLCNLKGQDKVVCMDIWFHFLKDKPYPNNIWDSSKKEVDGMNSKDRNKLLKHLRIKEFDLDYMIARFPEFIEEELSFLNKKEKEIKK